VALAPVSNSTVTLYGVVDSITMQPGHVSGATIYVQSYYNNPQIMAPTRLFTAVTGDDGNYKLTLPAGNYLAYAAKDTLQSPTIKLNLSQDTKQDFVLESQVIPLARQGKKR